MLDFPAITNLIDLLTKRCAVARIALHEALTDFEFSTHTLLAETSYNKLVEDIPAYLGVFRNAIVVSRTIFPAQEAYRSALTTLGMLITDLVDVLPEKCAVKKSMKENLGPGLKKADKVEQGYQDASGCTCGSREQGQRALWVDGVYEHGAREVRELGCGGSEVQGVGWRVHWRAIVRGSAFRVLLEGCEMQTGWKRSY
jgi:hypothetical protein